LPFLVESTIEENIKLLNPELSDDELENILDICDVRSIVQKQDRGLQCKIGENGVQLSVGERKRIQIAQAIAKKADIYMFDELTASLDEKTAKCIMKSISEYLKDKTVIFIEHRLEMIDGIKEIYEFKNNGLERRK
jgi:ABC-type transport system involved in cytochrome bd biosynthesis fused ATPase/permease subunit